jgi:excisionase family DNA binding protein
MKHDPENSPAPGAGNDYLLNKDQLAKLLGIKRRGVEGLMKDRKIPVLRLGRRCIRFELDKVMASLRRLEQRAIGDSERSSAK